jgi:Flp pilus assembly protein TadB
MLNSVNSQPGADGNIGSQAARPMATTATGARTKEGTVPLSEHEQRLLEQIEQALYAEDPKFASAVRAGRSRMHTRRWIIISVVGVLAGLAVVLVGLTAKLVVLGVIGFVLIVASCVYVATMLRSKPGRNAEVGEAGAKSRRPGVRSRMEDRLRKRFDEQ